MSAHTLRIALDLRQPLAYLALGPALALAQEFGALANVVPFAGPALRAPSAGPALRAPSAGPTLRAPTAPAADDDRGTIHRRHRAHMLAREIAVYADAQGLHIEQPYRDGAATAAHHAWLWVARTQPARLPDFLERIFAAYWRAELDANDPAAVRRVLQDAQLEADAFDAWARREGAAQFEALDAELRAAGVFQAPSYLVDDELFVGRQHLPMIRWKLGDGAGPPPI